MLTKREIEDLAAMEIESNRQIGSRNIEEMIGDESEKFDRRKFGRMQCGFCNETFNPFYLKSLEVTREWSMVWVGCDHRQPEKHYKCKCKRCKSELYFSIYIGQ